MSLVGKRLTAEREGKVYTLVFSEDGKATVSGGDIGDDGVAAKYEQDGERVQIQIAGEELGAIYDGETLEFEAPPRIPQDRRIKLKRDYPYP